MTRYSRQISLPEIGEGGQKKLHKARVLIVGAGGLGSPAALYLAGAGVGTIGLADDDTVGISNLQRQVLYTENEVGQLKVHCAAQRLRALNGNIEVNVYPFRLNRENARRLIADYDIVVDGCDNFSTRYLISDSCSALHKPYVYGAIQAPDNSVIGVTPAVVGSVEASETLKLICGYGEVLAGKLWTVDLRTMQSFVLLL